MDKIRKEGQVYCSASGLPDIEAVGPFDMLAYTSAFVDGDGSFSMTREALSPSISVYNNNPDLLRNLMPVIGGGLHQNHRGEWQLRIGSIPKCKAVCEMLIPRLITKKQQAETLLQACVLPNNQRAPIGEALSAMNKKKTFARLPDSPSLKIATTKCPIEWSYFGGYADTDSSLDFQTQIHGTSVYYYPQFSVYCKNPAPMLWLQQRFGGQIQSRKRDGKWITSLEFEDQVHVVKILTVLRPYVLDKKSHIDILVEACDRGSKERGVAASKLKAIGERFRGLHKFMKTADGKYVDGKRSTTKPHKKHKGVPFEKPQEELNSDQIINPVEDRK